MCRRSRQISRAAPARTTTAKTAMKVIRPLSAGEENCMVLSRKRSHHSEQATYRKVAMQDPEMEPMPPMTTMSRIS